MIVIISVQKMKDCNSNSINNSRRMKWEKTVQTRVALFFQPNNWLHLYHYHHNLPKQKQNNSNTYNKSSCSQSRTKHNKQK